MSSDPVLKAWEDALAGRLAAAESALGRRSWQEALATAETVWEGLRRADPLLARRHHAALHRLAAIAVRAAWELAPLQHRADMIEKAFLMCLDFVPDLALQDAIDVVPAPPPELDETLPRWARALGDWVGRWQDHEAARARLQREAFRRDLGADGLGRIARQSDELDVWLAWVDALDEEGRHEEALRAAAAGARTLYWPRHRLQLRLREGAAAQALGRTDQALRAWREVWRHRSCTAGLCMVWEVAGAHATALVQEELERAYTEERVLPVDLQVRMELLCGDADVPVARLQAADPRGWWDDREHPATQVLPFLLRVGTHQARPDEALLTTRVWRGTDDDGRWRPRAPDPIPTGWSRLVDDVIATHPTWLTDAVAWRVTAGNALIELAGAVIAAQARPAYIKVAALLVALVEAGHVADDPEAEAPLRAIRRRFPRHKALLRTLDELRQHSPVLRE
ncbi:MAG: hypothetical protein H6742_16030 [Alphaproteobacteria bacterium]|nr:hypothetical protein [Alphaproteobacteria bacterium]